MNHISIELRSGIMKKELQVPIDDYILHAVMKRGSIVSRPGKPLYVEVLDFSTHNNIMVFKMTLLDSSCLMELHPQFDEGLPGIWQLMMNGYLRFVGLVPKQFESIEAFLVDGQSNALVRERYKKIFGTSIETKAQYNVSGNTAVEGTSTV